MGRSVGQSFSCDPDGCVGSSTFALEMPGGILAAVPRTYPRQAYGVGPPGLYCMRRGLAARRCCPISGPSYGRDTKWQCPGHIWLVASRGLVRNLPAVPHGVAAAIKRTGRAIGPETSAPEPGSFASPSALQWLAMRFNELAGATVPPVVFLYCKTLYDATAP